MKRLLRWFAAVGVDEVRMPSGHGRTSAGPGGWTHGARATSGQLGTSRLMNDILRRLDALEAGR